MPNDGLRVPRAGPAHDRVPATDRSTSVELGAYEQRAAIKVRLIQLCLNPICFVLECPIGEVWFFPAKKYSPSRSECEKMSSQPSESKQRKRKTVQKDKKENKGNKMACCGCARNRNSDTLSTR